jgi:hypothetical protein
VRLQAEQSFFASSHRSVFCSGADDDEKPDAMDFILSIISGSPRMAESFFERSLSMILFSVYNAENVLCIFSAYGVYHIANILLAHIHNRVSDERDITYFIADSAFTDSESRNDLFDLATQSFVIY